MRTLISMFLVVMIISCGRNKSNQAGSESVSGEKIFEVTEVLQAASYTYLKVKEAGEERWVAITRQEVAIGDKLYYDNALEMNNFHSKDLNRDFEKVFFISNVSKTPLTSDGQLHPETHSGKVETPQSVAPMKKAENELTIAGLYSKKAEYSGKEVEIRGMVVKIVKDVMGKNWVHIQDGTNAEGKFDLTITTGELPELNEDVTFKGKLIVDKDFGYGYFYEIIIEDGIKVVKKQEGSPV